MIKARMALSESPNYRALTEVSRITDAHSIPFALVNLYIYQVLGRLKQAKRATKSCQ